MITFVCLFLNIFTAETVFHIATVMPLNTDVVLQDPQAAIPKGTLLAILITGVTYLAVAVSVCKYRNPLNTNPMRNLTELTFVFFM